MSQPQPPRQRRPSYLRRISGYLFPTPTPQSNAASGKQPVRAQHEQQQISERSPLLGTPSTLRPSIPASASDDVIHRPLSTSTVIARPHLTRATTIAAPTYHQSSDIDLPSRNRANTSTDALTGHPELYPQATLTAAMERPSLLSRAAIAITNHLELGDGTSHAHRNAPPPPSYWDDNTHQRYLVRLWDVVTEKAANSKYNVTLTARVVSTEKSMILAFPELAKGDRLLTRDWIEYVLGVALRHPFCTAENMGRWEILASSSGARGTWGPW